MDVSTSANNIIYTTYCTTAGGIVFDDASSSGDVNSPRFAVPEELVVEMVYEVPEQSAKIDPPASPE